MADRLSGMKNLIVLALSIIDIIQLMIYIIYYIFPALKLGNNKIGEIGASAIAQKVSDLPTLKELYLGIYSLQ